MKMQRMVCFFLSCILVIAICGCSDKNRNNGAETGEQTITTSIPDETTNTETTGNEEEIKESDTKGEMTAPESTNKGSETTSHSDAATTPASTEKSGSTTKPAPTSKPEGTKPTTCKHSETKVKNKKPATCTSAGYTGDVYCEKCETLISKGSSIQATGHRNTEIRNKKEATVNSAGYTGDTYCTDCGRKIATGNNTPKLDNTNGKLEYIFPDGSSLWAEPDADIIGILMAQKTKKANHLYVEVEKEILRLCNIERQKAGLKPLAWFEDAYYFTQIRAEEASQLWSHTRPNGGNWVTVYTDAGVFLLGSSGENLFETVGYTIEEYAACAVEGWMNSPGHRANILNPKFTRIAIAIVQHDAQLTAAQNFFS